MLLLEYILRKYKSDQEYFRLNNIVNNVEKKLASDFLEEEDDDETDLFSLIDSMYEENNE